MSDVVNDWDFLQPFMVTILRGTGDYDGHGLYNPKTMQSFTVRIVIQQSTPKDLEALPEGERNRDTIKWWLTPQLYMADGITPQLSDVIVWRDKYYRVITCADRSDNGFYNGLAQAAPNTGGTAAIVPPAADDLSRESLLRRDSWIMPGDTKET